VRIGVEGCSEAETGDKGGALPSPGWCWNVTRWYSVTAQVAVLQRLTIVRFPDAVEVEGERKCEGTGQEVFMKWCFVMGRRSFQDWAAADRQLATT
jgi:hypothetical protein